MKRIAISVLALLTCAVMGAQNSNTMFEDAFNAIQNKNEVFRAGARWFPYPDYSDRAAWDRLLGSYKEKVIKVGEKDLKYEWKPILASTYLEYEKTGNRGLMKFEEKNRMALNHFIAAELAEGKGRFIPKIADFLWLETTRYSWSHAQHTARQKSHRTLPVRDDKYITLHSANNAASIAIAWYFFHEELDKLDPSISLAVQQAVKEHVFDPYLDESKDLTGEHSFFGFKKTKALINNWNPYCNCGVLLAFLLMCRDQDMLIRGLERSVKSIDAYLSYIPQDGCCDEGPGYWRMSFGKMYEYARIMADATGGRMNLLKDPFIVRMGEFKSRTDLGDHWVMSYSDGSARSIINEETLFRFGTDCGSRELVDYSVSLMVDSEGKKFNPVKIQYSEIYNALEDLRYLEAFENARKAALDDVGGNWDALVPNLRRKVGSICYQDSQQAVLRNGKGWILCAKGGHNNESHNHNDVGSMILFVDDMPVIIDPGVSTYVKETFSKKRYTLWCMQSDWHNLPKINGASQHNGREFAASYMKCDLKKNEFETEFSKAYPSEASCDRLCRKAVLGSSSLTVTDTYSLRERKAADEERFIVRGDVQIKDGYVLIETRNFAGDEKKTFKLTYPSTLTPAVEVKKVESWNKKIRDVWGDEIKCICFKSAADAPVSGTYKFEFKKK